MATRRNAAAPLAAYVLHHHDWSESSLILDLFTRELGRIVVVAKGAKRPYSQLRCVLLPFQRLLVQLGSKRQEEGTEVQLLRSAEWGGGGAMPGGAGLLAGFHLNELLLRGLARQDPHATLFDTYAATLPVLASGDDAGTAAALRAFELHLLADTGVLPELHVVTATQRPVDTGARHLLHPETGVQPLRDGETGLPGAVLTALQVALDARDLAGLRSACLGAPVELRNQLRQMLHYHLGTSALRTRALMVEVQKLIEP
ncbi:DNA replication and repair protein RecO [Sphaerotilus hippei]|uniref:DNA repair protein RecO n=1 Tax=Sphaerotilus hippei TaxID=744406 RepID=A0A318H1W2_9BURK|nr:DNA repair protein RecO [Sphaerotilus hippei]PXW97032.1 DNA replication and repair protein RecO [Sphaerotilus hippei]